MEKLKFPGDCQLELESCGCNDSDTENDFLSIPKYHKNKRFSVIVEEELLRYVLMNDEIFLFTFLFTRNGYPSLLIVNGQRHLSCNNIHNLSQENINKTSYQVKLGRVQNVNS